MNLVVLVGRLTKDAEARETKAGKTYVTFAVETPHPFRAGETGAFGCVAWSKAAESAKGLKAGSVVAVAGFLQQRQWAQKDGNTRDVIEVSADRVELVGAKTNGAARAGEAESVEPDDPFGNE